jgi:ADP-glucose pyrophosphorylase
MYVQVNIGRSVTGQGPLTADEWQAFQADTKSVVNDLIWDLAANYKDIEIEKHVGRGVYLDTSEESVHFSFFIPANRIITKPPQTAAAMTSFTRALRVLAREYHQDAIAVIAGSRLIKAAPPAHEKEHAEGDCNCGV